MIDIETIPMYFPAWDRNLMRNLAQAVLDLSWRVTSAEPLTIALITWTPGEIEHECRVLFPEKWVPT